MFALPGLLALIFVEYLRPQEYVAALQGLPLLHLATALSGLGLVVDLRLGLARLRPAPQLLLTILFFLWCVATVVVRSPAQAIPRAAALAIPLAFYLVVSHAIQSLRAFEAVCGLLLAIALGLSVIGVHQGMADTACHRVVTVEREIAWIYDGRPCQVRTDCENEDAEPNADYACEKVGLLGTSSINGRARFRGSLQDPNELSLVLGMAMPFAFAFLERRRTVVRRVLAVATVALVGACAYFTQSRGGQLVFLVVLAVYFLKRIGVWRGMALGLALALPVLLFGGRSGAEDSTLERIECWWTGLHLFLARPVLGVGSGQFLEHHFLTAHNSFILAAAELGLPGLILWSAVMYLSVKIAIETIRSPVAPAAQVWATALLSSMAGLLAGLMLLSLNYKDVLWLYVALTGALHETTRRHEPAFMVKFGLRDLGVVVLLDAAIIGTLVGYTGLKLGW